jgi:nucleoside-diphosphate-sugar epimerase
MQMTLPGNITHALVTGGLGFIGSTICERLLSLGLHVTVVDDESSNVIEGSDLTRRFSSNVTEGSNLPHAVYVNEEISKFLLTNSQALSCDLVIHAASYVGAAGVLPHAGVMAQHMINATGNVIQFCIEQQAQLCYFSSSEIYGRSGILSESMDVRVPPYFNARIEYALAKLTGEAMIANSSHKGLRATIFRPFNVVGPRQSRVGGFVLPTFVQQALGNKPLSVFESGLQKRAFLDVEDLVDLVEICISEQGNQVLTVNAGNPRNTVTVNSLARRVVEHLNSRSSVEFVDPKSIYGPLYMEAESVEKMCDISLAESLGWTPKCDLERIIRRTADFYQTHRDTGGADARN